MANLPISICLPQHGIILIIQAVVLYKAAIVEISCFTWNQNTGLELQETAYSALYYSPMLKVFQAHHPIVYNLCNPGQVLASVLNSIKNPTRILLSTMASAHKVQKGFL